MNNIIVQSDTFGVEGSTWARIFHHNSTNEFFFKEKSAKFSLNKDTFSLLSRIDDDFKHDDMFEYILEYPEPKSILHWKQDKNPIYLKYNDEYNIEKLDNTESFESFYGLTLSGGSSTFLSGSAKDGIWCFAIGAYSYFTSKNRFPGPRTGKGYTLVNLYIRIWDQAMLNKLAYKTKCTINKRRYFSLLIFLYFIFLK